METYFNKTKVKMDSRYETNLTKKKKIQCNNEEQCKNIYNEKLINKMKQQHLHK